MGGAYFFSAIHWLNYKVTNSLWIGVLLTSDEVDLLIYQPGECDIHRGHGRGEYHIPRVDKSRGQPISEVNNCFIKLFQNSINNAF